MLMLDGHQEMFPVSLAQAGMWLKQNVSTPDMNFLLAEAVEIHGPIDPDRFCQALWTLTQEAALTRSAIREVDGLPHQIVYPSYRGRFDVIDFSASDDPRAAAYAHMNAEVRRPRDFEREPLWASSLIKVGPSLWIWFHNVHHILMDGFSGGLLARRLAELYTALEEGRDPAPASFGRPQDLVAMEASYRQSHHFERDRTYWVQQMQDLPQPVTLAARKAEPSGGLLRHTVRLERTTVRRLEAIARLAGATLPQALIGLTAAYYARASDCDELTMLTMVAARLSEAMRRIPGMAANAVPLRFRVTEDVSFADLLRQVSQQMTRALRYQRYRYEDLRRDLGLVQYDEQIAWLGVNIEPFDYDLRFGAHRTQVENLSNGTMTELTVFAYERGVDEDVRLDFDANPALYSLAEIEDHAARYCALLERILDAPDLALCQISLLSDAERDLVLKTWNDRDHPLPEASLPDLFRQQAVRTPDAIALSFDDQALSYRALDAASDHLAGVLWDEGLARGGLVAVVLPRTPDLVVALLAVMKAGGTYLPLDPDDPPARLAMILEDAAPAMVITLSDLIATLQGLPTDCILMDRPLQRRATRLPPPPLPDDNAYMIFTSGSTGRPKGVVLHHRGLINLLLSMQHDLPLTAADRLLAVTTIAFDVAALELFWPLIAGARVVMARRSTVRDPVALRALLQSAGITLMQATPSLWRALLLDNPDDLKGLRPLVGGEALPADLAHRMARLGPPVVNLYGPTEVTICSTLMALAPGDLDHPPIGGPVWNTKLYVLDRHRQLVAPGVIGELYIGGVAVGRGYLNRPDLTEERFLPDPFAGGAARMYRTGDLVRWRSDGVLDYLGRNDQQIKIRGFRIEPGEIEAALAALPDVAEAVVILREDPGLDKRLVAYVVARPGVDLDLDDLPRRLARSLPSHMVPSAFVGLAAMPLNTNRKIDRSALPAPQWDLRQGYIAPRTPWETQIAALWCELLGLPQVGVHDSFFDRGGDSLTAAAMIAALRNRLQVSLPLAAVFETPTIAALAAQVETSSALPGLLDPLLPIRSLGRQAPLFCIHPALGMAWGYFPLARFLRGDIPIHGLQSDGLQDPEQMPRSIEAMASLYIERIRSQQPQGPYRLLGWSLGGLIAQEMTAQLQASGETVSFLGLLDAFPFRPDAVLTDERHLAQVALQFLGLDPAAIGDVSDLATLGTAVFRSLDAEQALFLAQVGRDDPGFANRVQTAILMMLDLACRHRPRRIAGDLHFFQAAESRASAALSTVMEADPQIWTDLVEGFVTVHAIDASHLGMMAPEPARAIAAILEAEIIDGPAVPSPQWQAEVRQIA